MDRAILTFGSEQQLARDIACMLRGEPVERAAFPDPFRGIGLLFGDDGSEFVEVSCYALPATILVYVHACTKRKSQGAVGHLVVNASMRRSYPVGLDPELIGRDAATRFWGTLCH